MHKSFMSMLALCRNNIDKPYAMPAPLLRKLAAAGVPG